jgi:hypothetical protein
MAGSKDIVVETNRQAGLLPGTVDLLILETL